MAAEEAIENVLTMVDELEDTQGDIRNGKTIWKYSKIHPSHP